MIRVGMLAVAVLVIAWAQPIHGQQSIEYASVGGRVADPSGAAIAGAHVAARQTETNVTVTADTDETGRFRFPYLRIGPYEIAVQQDGFRAASMRLTLGAGAAHDFPVTLQIAGIDSSVTVSAEATVLETARSQVAGTLPQAEVASIPLNGRQFLELALFVPGVSPTNVASTQLFPETSAVPGVSLSIGSQRNLSNNFIVDGLSANDDAAGLSGMTYSVDAVEQFQVITSGAQAELGRALGGYINVVTRSGTNALRGAGYVYGRHDALNAAHALSGSTLPMQQTQYGGSVGGPIVRNRAFYFVNAERRELDQTGLVTIAPSAVAAINDRLLSVGYRGPLVTTGEYRNPVDSLNLLAKVDHQVSGRDQLSLRYGRYDADASNARGAGGLNAPSASSALDNVDQAVAAANTLTFGFRTVLETRAQLARSGLQAPPTDPIGPAVSIAGVASFGRLSNSPTGRRNRMYQIVNNVSHQRGTHAMRAGVDFLHNENGIRFPRAAGGAYTFSSLATFLTGVYNNTGFSQTFGVPGVEQVNPNVGIYAQDEWKAVSGLTFNLGVRYDLQYLETLETDTNNLSPRLGVAWSPSASGRAVVRGSAGLFYDRVPLRALANALLSAGNTTEVTKLRQIAISLSPGQSGAPVFPATLAALVPAVTLPNLATMDRRLQNAYSRQASVELEQQVGERVTVSAGYQYLRGLNLLMSINQNVPSCVPAGTNNGCRPIPDYANNGQFSSAGESNYHGLHLAFLQRPGAWGGYRLSYTLSKSMNNVGEFFFSSPIDPFDLNKDWGRSDDDQRHRLVANGSLQVPGGFQVSGVVQAYSALPFNITSGVTTIQGTAGRPIVNGEFIERNAGTGSDFFNVSARVSRTFALRGSVRLETIVEGFNLTNRVNVVARNTNFGGGAYPDSPVPSFGQATAVGEPRSAQLGLRVSF